MSVEVVKRDGFHKDNPVWGGDKYLKYVNYDGYATVPDMSDLDSKASNADLRNLKDDFNGAIEDVKSETEQTASELSNNINIKLEDLKNEILSNERLEFERRALECIKEDIIEEITNLGSSQIEIIRNEIETFKNIDLNETLQPIKSSVSDSINKLNEKSDKIITQISTIDGLDRKIDRYADLLNEMHSVLEKIQSIHEDVKNEKSNIKKEVDTQLSIIRKEFNKKIVEINDSHSKMRLRLSICIVICIITFLFLFFFD